MTLNLSDSSLLKGAVLLGLPLIFLACWAWLAGAIFLQFNGYEMKEASLLTVYQYWYYYRDSDTTMGWLTGSVVAALVVLLLPLLIVIMPRKAALFGEARWATESEIRKAGLYAEDGIIVGRKAGFLGLFKRYLIFGGSQHVLMAAPTRSGKGVSVVIPNLLIWKDSVVVLDVKQENWDITAGFRSHHGQDCYLLNLAPRDYRTHHWNPLFYISDDPHFRINDIQKIGQMLFPKVEGEAPIWQASARSLWLGLVLYLMETEELPVTLGEALRQLTMGDERLAAMLEKRQQSESPLSDECYLALKEYLDTPEKTRGSIRKGFTASLELFYNPVIDAATSENDFDLRDLRKKRMSIYVGITVDDLERLARLINLFFQQVIDLNTRELPEQNPSLKYQCLLVMDEFTAMGKVGILSKGISYIAGYGLRMLPIIQSPAQLRETYGADAAETFIDNHALQVIFAPKNVKVAKEISETLGTKTVKNKSKTRQLVGRSSRSENTSDHSRALLLPQEIKQIGQKAEILILDNCPPIKCQKVTWYKDRLFTERGNNRGVITWASPEVPLIDPDARPKGKVSFAPSSGARPTTTNVERPVTEQDIANIDNLDLDDFTCDFSSIEIPKGEIDDAAMDELVDQFFSGIQAA